ncbi:unnamed protein product [Effrenium voratum]|nr:unnamed protein product [Effrenium voratum]
MAEAKEKPKSSLKPRRTSRRNSRKEDSPDGGGSDGGPSAESIAISKITGQAKALKFAMDLAKKAYVAREEDNLQMHPEVEEEEPPEEDAPTSHQHLEPEDKEEKEMMEMFSKLENPVFKPAPLLVRGLCQSARRACTRQLSVAEPRLAEALALRDGRRSEPELLTEDEQMDLGVTCRRLQYHVALLQRRWQRLCQIDNTTFQQLPQQLIEAGADGDYDFIKLCVEAQVPLDVFNERGVTALITATVNNKVQSARLLLDAGADPSMQDINGANCAHYAIELQRFQILDVALEAMNRRRTYVALYVKDARGKTVLDYARSPGHEDSLRLLKLRLGGPLGFVWAVGDSMVHNAVLKLPNADKSRKGLAKHVARLAAERAANNVKEKINAAKEKAREKLLGGKCCSYCSVATISKKKMEETIMADMSLGENEWFPVTSLCRFRELDHAMSECMEAVLRPTCLLVQNLLPAYEAVIQNNDDGQSEEEGGIAPMVAQTMELLQVMATRSKLKGLLKNRVKNLIQLLVPFMRITESQVAAWKADPNEYLQQEEDDHFRGCMVRLSGEGLLGVMMETFKREAHRSLAGVVADLLERGESSRGDASAWKLTELGLLIFSIAVQEASAKSLQRSDLGPQVPSVLALAAKLSGDKASPEFLRARAFSLLHRLADTVTSLAGQEVPRLLEGAAAGLASTEPLIVRVSACRVFCRFLTSTQDEALREELLLKKGVLASLGSLLREADEELLHLCLECLCIIVKQCPATMAKVEADLCPLTLQIWRRCASDPLVHMQVLDLVSCCISSGQLQKAMEDQLLPVVHSDLQPEADPQLASSAMELFGVLLKRATLPLAAGMWTCAGLLLAKAMQSDESMMLQNACETLVSLVQRAPEPAAQLLEPLLRFAERLLGPDLDDDACLYVGPLAMLLFAHYGRVLPAQMQVALLRALVVRLGRAERPYLRQELVVVFARLLHEDMDGSLQVLANLEVPSGSGHRNGLELLMSTWLTCAADMRARRARNITVSALCRLHERCKEDPQLRAKLGEAASPDRLLQTIVAGLEFENERCSRLIEADALLEDSEDEEESHDQKQNFFLSDVLDLEDCTN